MRRVLASMPCVRQVRQVSFHRMLERLQLRNVGPAPEMALDLASRINLITGDNGLGKSFLLDVAWWALTRRWPRDLNPRLTSGYPARPTNVRDAATLAFTVTTATGASIAYESTIVHASAGIRRIAALAYMLVWSWVEHTRAAEQLGSDYTHQIVLLFDEIEAHLHPLWQRTIVPALLKVMESLTDYRNPRARDPSVQLVAATHSPLVLASVEPLFEVERDRLFHLDVRDGVVRLDEEPWAKQGDVVNWLVSETFGLRQGRSVEAERAIEAAEAFMRNDRGGLVEGLTTQSGIQRELNRVLPGHDPFWPRWVVHNERGRTSET